VKPNAKRDEFERYSGGRSCLSRLAFPTLSENFNVDRKSSVVTMKTDQRRPLFSWILIGRFWVIPEAGPSKGPPEGTSGRIRASAGLSVSPVLPQNALRNYGTAGKTRTQPWSGALLPNLLLLPGGRPRRFTSAIHFGGRPRRLPRPAARRSKVMIASTSWSRSTLRSASIFAMSMVAGYRFWLLRSRTTLCRLRGTVIRMAVRSTVSLSES